MEIRSGASLLKYAPLSSPVDPEDSNRGEGLPALESDQSNETPLH